LFRVGESAATGSPIVPSFGSLISDVLKMLDIGFCGLFFCRKSGKGESTEFFGLKNRIRRTQMNFFDSN
jgi:hypothetical protein